jgi:hypothetical protein
MSLTQQLPTKLLQFYQTTKPEVPLLAAVLHYILAIEKLLLKQVPPLAIATLGPLVTPHRL